MSLAITLSLSELRNTQDGDSVFSHDEFHVYVGDGSGKWVELEYTFANGTAPEKKWDFASTNFTLPAATVSQYFSLGSTPVQIRTSGYSKFADTEIPAEVLGDVNATSADGKSIDVTGILTIYNGSAQFTLIDLDGVKVN